jgi:hypothetical protein
MMLITGVLEIMDKNLCASSSPSDSQSGRSLNGQMTRVEPRRAIEAYLKKFTIGRTPKRSNL